MTAAAYPIPQCGVTPTPSTLAQPHRVADGTACQRRCCRQCRGGCWSLGTAAAVRRTRRFQQRPPSSASTFRNCACRAATRATLDAVARQACGHRTQTDGCRPAPAIGLQARRAPLLLALVGNHIGNHGIQQLPALADSFQVARYDDRRFRLVRLYGSLVIGLIQHGRSRLASSGYGGAQRDHPVRFPFVAFQPLHDAEQARIRSWRTSSERPCGGQQRDGEAAQLGLAQENLVQVVAGFLVRSGAVQKARPPATSRPRPEACRASRPGQRERDNRGWHEILLVFGFAESVLDDFFVGQPLDVKADVAEGHAREYSTGVAYLTVA